MYWELSFYCTYLYLFDCGVGRDGVEYICRSPVIVHLEYKTGSLWYLGRKMFWSLVMLLLYTSLVYKPTYSMLQKRQLVTILVTITVMQQQSDVVSIWRIINGNHEISLELSLNAFFFYKFYRFKNLHESSRWTK